MQHFEVRLTKRCGITGAMYLVSDPAVADRYTVVAVDDGGCGEKMTFAIADFLTNQDAEEVCALINSKLNNQGVTK